MRIALVTDSFPPCADAAADTARQICDALVSAGHDLLVITSTPGTGSYRGAAVVRARRTVAAGNLRATVAAFAPDVVQVLRPRVLGATALRGLEDSAVPVVVLDPTVLHPRVGTVLASTQAGVRMLRMVGVPAREWAPGVRTDEHHPGLRSAELHDAWARDRSHVVVGYAGPVGQATAKHVRRLVRIAGLDGVRLVVLGSGPGTTVLKESGARIVGACGGLELARGIASLDVFVQPRKHEAGLGVVRKALASGVPVVAFDTASNADVLTSGRNGLLVPPGEGRTGLRDAVAGLVGDAPLRAELAARARDSVAGRTWADAVDELLALYRPLADAG